MEDSSPGSPRLKAITTSARPLLMRDWVGGLSLCPLGYCSFQSVILFLSSSLSLVTDEGGGKLRTSHSLGTVPDGRLAARPGEES